MSSVYLLSTAAADILFFPLDVIIVLNLFFNMETGLNLERLEAAGGVGT